LLSLLDEALPPRPVDRKRVKPDFEALARLPICKAFPKGGLLAFGSGSSERRQRAVLLEAQGESGSLAVTKVLNLAPLFEPLRARFPELNIEGVFVDGERFCLLQRGHRLAPVNACIAYSWESTRHWLTGTETGTGTGGPPEIMSVSNFELGCIEDVPLCFTDGAALPDGGWVFCAAAEDTSDSYHDGECKGSALGRVDASGRMVSLEPLSVLCKAEGISVRVEGDTLHLLLVTDADDPKVPALLLATTLDRINKI
jgi:hypothetical protein